MRGGRLGARGSGGAVGLAEGPPRAGLQGAPPAHFAEGGAEARGTGTPGRGGGPLGACGPKDLGFEYASAYTYVTAPVPQFPHLWGGS